MGKLQSATTLILRCKSKIRLLHFSTLWTFCMPMKKIWSARKSFTELKTLYIKFAFFPTECVREYLQTDFCTLNVIVTLGSDPPSLNVTPRFNELLIPVGVDGISNESFLVCFFLPYIKLIAHSSTIPECFDTVQGTTHGVVICRTVMQFLTSCPKPPHFDVKRTKASFCTGPLTSNGPH